MLQRRQVPADAREFGHPFIYREGAVRSHDVVTLLAEGPDHRRDDFVRPIPHQELAGVFAESFRQRQPQGIGVAAGIERRAGGRELADDLARGGRGAERIFIVIQPVQHRTAKKPLEFLVRLAGHIALELLDVVGNQTFKIHDARVSLHAF